MNHPMDSVFEENYKRVENPDNFIARILHEIRIEDMKNVYLSQQELDNRSLFLIGIIDKFDLELKDYLIAYNSDNFFDKVYSNDKRSDDNR